MEEPADKDQGMVLEIVELFDATAERVFKAWITILCFEFLPS
jgi:hypothetical protein